MLKRWERKYPNSDWIDIVKALQAIDRNDIAQKVCSKYIGSTTLPPGSPSPQPAQTVSEASSQSLTSSDSPQRHAVCTTDGGQGMLCTIAITGMSYVLLQ